MLYRRFGKTGLQMPLFTCGGMRFQHSWIRSDSPPIESFKNTEAVVNRAMELGINHFDTANGYGTSDEELGCALRKLPRDSFYLQTKAPIRDDPKVFLGLFEESMRALKLEYVDLFSLHGINNDKLLDLSIRKGGCLDVALELKKQGRVRNIGFSTHGTSETIVKTIKTGGFDYVYLHWYYIFQDNWPAIVEAKKHDMGVMILSPNDKGGMLYKPSEKLTRLTAPLSPMVFNDLFILSRPEINTLTIGAGVPEDFNEHLKGLKMFDRAEELAKPVAERLENELKNALGEDWASTWNIGLPAWHETPGNINIPTILFLWNVANAYDMVEYGKMRFNLMGNADHWFPGNKPENLESFDFSECLRNSPNAKIIPGILCKAFDLLAGKEVKRLGKH